MKTVINLSNNSEHSYSDDISDLFAVCCAYCLNNNLQSWFYDQVDGKKDYRSALPVTVGKQTLACGNYCIVKTDKPELKLY